MAGRSSPPSYSTRTRSTFSEYVPELRDATPEQVHGWTGLDDETREVVAPDYPAPIVDHAERREEAIETFEQARGDG